MNLSQSANYYRYSKKARKKKHEYDTKLNRRKNQIQKRVEANRARRLALKLGRKLRGKDYDHAVGKFVPIKINRGRKGEGGR